MRCAGGPPNGRDGSTRPSLRWCPCLLTPESLPESVPSPSPPPWPSTPRPRPSRRPADPSSGSAPASRTSRRRTTSSRPPSAACRDPRWHRYTPAGGLPELKEAVAAKTLRDSGLVVKPSQVLITNGGKQALYNAFAALLDPGDEVLLPAPYWTTYPESIAPGRRDDRWWCRPAGERATARRSTSWRPPAPPAPRSWSSSRPSNPTGRGLLPGGRRGDRPLGRRARALGRHRRDLRAPRLRRRRVLLDAGAGPRARRPLHRRQRRGQDLRHDRLARGLADRPRRHRQGGHQPAVARDLERRQRLPDRGPGRGVRRPGRRRGDEGGLRPAAAARSSELLAAIPGVALPRAGGRVLRVPVGRGPPRAASSAGSGRRPRPSSPR